MNDYICCVYGKKVILNGIHTWRIRVNKLVHLTNGSYNSIIIGVINTLVADMRIIKDQPPHRQGCYGFDTMNGSVMTNQYGGYYVTPKFTTRVGKPGDIISIKLNMYSRTLSCWINGNHIGQSITGMKSDGKYRLLLSMELDKGTELELL